MDTLLATARRRAGPTLRRTREIARVLGGHGLESVLDHTGLRRFAPRIGRLREPAASRLTQAQRVRLALGELGATFIKLGQMLSTRGDLLSEEFVAELSTLQDSAPPVAFAEVERIVREDLGRAESPFLSFEEIPLASASIGQVHAARLLDGTPVVVKVRRPGVVEQVELDLAILRSGVAWMQAHTPIGRDYELMDLVDEFAYTIRNEMDYVREGENADRLRAALAEEAAARIPHVYHDLTTERVLTLERVDGVRITDTAALDRLGISRRAVAQNAVRIYLQEILEVGFFQADPHPGNFFVQPDGSLAIVDFGMVGRLSETTRDHLLRAGLAGLREDAEGLTDELFALGVAGRRADRDAFQKDLEHLIARFSGRTLEELSASAVTGELTRIVLRHKLQLPSELALLLRVINMSEGVGLTLDPDFRYLEYADPIVKAHWRRLYSVPAVAARAARAAADYAELSLDLPRRLARLLGRLERGETQLTVHHQGTEGFTRELQRMTNRLALSMILAASIVALGLAVGIRSSPELDPVVGWLFRLGLLFSLVFGASVLWGIWRATKH